MLHTAAFVIAGSLATMTAVHQALPPPGDGEIRVLYWELRKETEIWLTLELKPPGKPPAPTVLFTCTRWFQGKKPAGPPQDFELRVYAGALWAPRVEFWFLLDDSVKLDLAASNRFGLLSGGASDYLSAKVSVPTFQQLAAANSIVGNAFGIGFELDASQRRGLRMFLDRAMSDDPAQWPRVGSIPFQELNR